MSFFFSHQKLFSMEPHGQKIIPKSLDAVKQPMYRPEDDLERGAAKEGTLQWGGGAVGTDRVVLRRWGARGFQGVTRGLLGPVQVRPTHCCIPLERLEKGEARGSCA